VTNDIEAAARAAAEYVDGVWRKDAGTAWTPIRLPLIRDAVASALAHATRGGVKCAKCGEVISTAGCLCGSNTPVTIAPSHATGEGGTRGEVEKARERFARAAIELRHVEDALYEAHPDDDALDDYKENVTMAEVRADGAWADYLSALSRALPEAREGKS
jgi:hypothetical protein